MSEDTKAPDALKQEIVDAVAERVEGSELSDARRAEVREEAVRAATNYLETATHAEAEKMRRKVKFGQGGEDHLRGTKYEGLEHHEVELLMAVRSGVTGQKTVGDGGVYGAPSEELQNVAAETRSRAVIPATAQFNDSGRFYGSKARAMDTAESGFGSQLIGNQYVGTLWEAARRTARVWPLLRSFPMDAPTAYLPVEVDFPEMLFVSESTASNSSNFTTSKTGSQRVQVDAKMFAIHQMWSGAMEEDSIVPYLPFLSGQATKSVAYYQDSLVVNGDTTSGATGNVNLDDATPAATKHYLAFDGMRHVGIVDNTNNGTDASGAVTYADFGDNLRIKMHDATNKVDWGYPNSPGDLVFLSDRATANKVGLLDEVITVDKYGPSATVLTGEQAMIGRNPLVVSEAMSLTESDGKVSTTAGNNTLGQVLAFNRNGFVIGLRRTLRVETERIPATDQTRIVYTARWGFGRFTPDGTAASIEAAAVLYNITV